MTILDGCDAQSITTNNERHRNVRSRCRPHNQPILRGSYGVMSGEREEFKKIHKLN